jgi:hypothetical protein
LKKNVPIRWDLLAIVDALYNESGGRIVQDLGLTSRIYTYATNRATKMNAPEAFRLFCKKNQRSYEHRIKVIKKLYDFEYSNRFLCQ